MLLKILILSLVFPSLTNAGADVTPKQGLEDFKNFIEKMVELRLRDIETRMQDEKEKLELRLENMEMKMKNEREKHAKENKELDAQIRLIQISSNISNNALRKRC